MLTQPVDVLLSNSFKNRFGAIYAELKDNKPALATTLFHNLRCLALICLLVFLIDFPLAQSVVYACSAVLSAAWDLRFRPYEGRTTTIEAMLVGAAKLACAGGYIALCLESTTPGAVDGLNTYEVVIFVVAIGGGLLISLFQSASDIYETIRDWCKDKKSSGKVVALPEGSTEISQNTIMTHAN